MKQMPVVLLRFGDLPWTIIRQGFGVVWSVAIILAGGKNIIKAVIAANRQIYLHGNVNGLKRIVFIRSGIQILIL